MKRDLPKKSGRKWSVDSVDASIVRQIYCVTLYDTYSMYVASNQTLASNKIFISWMLINSDKRSAVNGSWNPGTSMLIQEGAVLMWH